MKQHTQPCAQCPWRRDSLRGWLGEDTPADFAATAESDERMPCHITVDYEREDWREQADSAPRCAGRAVYLRNRCKVPRDREEAEFVRSVERDADNVFTTAAAFIAHHSRQEVEA